MEAMLGHTGPEGQSGPSSASQHSRGAQAVKCHVTRLEGTASETLENVPDDEPGTAVVGTERVNLVVDEFRPEVSPMILQWPSPGSLGINGDQATIGTTTRLSGPVQFVLKLLEYWRLERRNAVGLLGFDHSDADHVAAILDGNEQLRGRDAQDRISHLFSIRKTLRSLFQDLDVENDWLRESHSLLDNKTPLSLMLEGSIEDLLLAREYVDTAAGR